MAIKEKYEQINEEAKKLLFMSDEDRITLINNILECNTDPQDRFMFICFYLYGMRPSELIEMKRGWITNKEGEIWIRIPTKKGGNERIIILDIGVPFMDMVSDYINGLGNPEDTFFNFKSPSNFNHRIDKMLKRYNDLHTSNLKVTPYVFRKFRLSWLWAAGATGADLLSYKGGRSLKPLENSYVFLKPVTKFKHTLR